MVEHATSSDKPTLVHCQAGKHRSTATGAAIRCAEGESPRTAMKEVKKQRPMADPNRVILRHADEMIGGNLEKEANRDLNVIPHVYWPAYKGGDPEEAQTYDESYQSPEAWEKDYEHEEHFTGYDVPEVEGNIRLKKDNLDELKEKGYSPKMKWLAADIDNPDHRELNEEDVERIKQKKQEDDLLGQAGVYSTPRGYRAVWPLDEPVDVEESEDLIENLHDKLKEKGENVDESAKDWTRMYRMPKVKEGFPDEEGERTSPDVLDFENMDTIEPHELKKESSMITKLARSIENEREKEAQGQQGRLTRKEFMNAMEVIQNLPDEIVKRILRQTKGRERRAVKKLLQYQEGAQNVTD